MGILDLRAALVILAARAYKVKEVSQAPRAYKVKEVSQAPRAYKVKQVYKELQDRMVKKVHTAQLVQEEKGELMGLRD